MKKILKSIVVFILVVIFLLFIIGQLNSSKIKKGTLVFSKEWQGKFTEIDGNKIRYIQKGTGKNVLLIHGTPGSIEDWQPIINDLSKNYNVTAFDRLGNGFSTANNYNYTLSENTEFVHKLIKKLDLINVVVVGHSFGGSMVTKMASKKNEHIKSYISVAAPLYQLDIDLNYKILTSSIIGKGATVLASKFLAPKMIEDGLNVTFGTNTNLLTKEFINTRKQLWLQTKVMYATSNIRSNYNNDLLESAKSYKNIKSKISFLVGEHDSKLIVKDFYSIKKEVPNAEYIFLKNTAHFIQFEQTQKLLTVIKQHLNTKNE